MYLFLECVLRITPYGHVVYIKMLHFAWKSFSATLRNRRGGWSVYGIPTAHAHVLTCNPLPVVQVVACGVRR